MFIPYSKHSKFHLEYRPLSQDLLDMPSSVYSPLQFPDEIRLLILQPARSGEDSQPKWQIKHARISDRPQYEALSYVWDRNPYEGESNASSQDGLVTNLSRALKHLRRVDEPDGRVLWIDALCVNQKDTNERNHQVTQMGEIYSQAESVIVWLGVGNSATRSAINMLSTQASEDWIIDGHYKPAITTPWILVPALLAFRALCR
ncbi:heterokaryon incompatibility protein-domain-containing protein, partial [Cadophora sp. MPI-SDFR-AT-0126]